MDCSTPQLIVFRQFGADNAPADALSHCRVVFLHSQAPRSLSLLTRLQMQIISPSASRPLSPWQRLHGTGEDVRLDPQHLQPHATACHPRPSLSSTEHRTSLHGASYLTPQSITEPRLLQPPPDVNTHALPASTEPSPTEHRTSLHGALHLTPHSIAPHSTKHPTSLHGASHLTPRSIAPNSTEHHTSLHGASHLTPRTIAPHSTEHHGTTPLAAIARRQHTPLLPARNRPPRSIASQQPR